MTIPAPGWREKWLGDPESRRKISQGYRPCTTCQSVLVLNTIGVCVPCREIACPNCGRKFIPSGTHGTHFCNDCRRYRRTE